LQELLARAAVYEMEDQDLAHSVLPLLNAFAYRKDVQQWSN
jgi:hypothetical protein